MKVLYIFLEELLLETEAHILPTVDDVVYINETYYVDEVVWYPSEDKVAIYLDLEKKSKKKSAIDESVNNKNLKDINIALQNSNEALKEIKTLKNKMLTMKTGIDNINFNTKKSHESR